MSNLAYYVEDISDDFQSTFSVVNDTTLANMLGSSPNDFEVLGKIISKYIPNAVITYVKTGEYPGKYDLYLISAVEEDIRRQ